MLSLFDGLLFSPCASYCWMRSWQLKKRLAWALFCFVVINPSVMSDNRIDFGLFLFHQFSNPPSNSLFHILTLPARVIYNIVFFFSLFFSLSCLSFFFFSFIPFPHKNSLWSAPEVHWRTVKQNSKNKNPGNKETKTTPTTNQLCKAYPRFPHQLPRRLSTLLYTCSRNIEFPGKNNKKNIYNINKITQ